MNSLLRQREENIPPAPGIPYHTGRMADPASATVLASHLDSVDLQPNHNELEANDICPHDNRDPGRDNSHAPVPPRPKSNRSMENPLRQFSPTELNRYLLPDIQMALLDKIERPFRFLLEYWSMVRAWCFAVMGLAWILASIVPANDPFAKESAVDRKSGRRKCVVNSAEQIANDRTATSMIVSYCFVAGLLLGVWMGITLNEYYERRRNLLVVFHVACGLGATKSLTGRQALLGWSFAGIGIVEIYARSCNTS